MIYHWLQVTVDCSRSVIKWPLWLLIFFSLFLPKTIFVIYFPLLWYKRQIKKALEIWTSAIYKPHAKFCVIVLGDSMNQSELPKYFQLKLSFTVYSSPYYYNVIHVHQDKMIRGWSPSQNLGCFTLDLKSLMGIIKILLRTTNSHENIKNLTHSSLILLKPLDHLNFSLYLSSCPPLSR